jgi:hypothetical protein
MLPIVLTMGCGGQVPEPKDRPLHVKQGHTWQKVIFESGGLAQPIVDKRNTIYIGDVSGNIFALNPDGSEKWKTKINGSIDSQPTLGCSETVYFESQDTICALSLEGRKKWERSFNGALGGLNLGIDNSVYFSYIHKNDTVYEALDPEGNRKSVYNSKSPGQLLGNPVFDSDGSMYIEEFPEAPQSLNNHTVIIHALRPDNINKTIWDYGFKELNKGGSSDLITGLDGNIYFVNGNDFYRLTGKGPKKLFRTSSDILDKFLIVGSDSTIYTTSAGKLYAINSNGTVKWIYDYGVTGGSFEPVIGRDGTVYLVTGEIDAWLHAIDKNGKLKWNLRLDINAMDCSAPAIGRDDVIYISTCEDGKLYAIGEGS